MYLIIETATQRGLVAVLSDSKVLAALELSLGLGNSRSLEPALEQVIKEAKVAPADLEFVAVGRGPGSYTGIRVGAASAKALSLGLNIPLVALGSLRGFVPPDDYEGLFCSVIDAKIGGVYFIEGKKEKGNFIFQGKEKLISIGELSERLKEIPSLVTPSWKPLEARLKGHLPLHVFERGPSATAFAQQAAPLFCKKSYTFDGACELLYLRLTQAEMEKLLNKPNLG